MLYKQHKTLARLLLAVSFTLLLDACGGPSSGGVVPTQGIVSGNTSGATTPSSNVTTGAFSLSWTAPIDRADGTPLALSEIAGYRVHYGKTKGSYPNHINITNGSLQSATLNGIPVGTYYVSMSTYDSSGLESSYSAPVIKQAL